MLCQVCLSIDWSAGFATLKDHHASFTTLVAAAADGCDMCNAIQQEARSAPNLVKTAPIRYQLMYGEETADGHKPLNQIRFFEYAEYLRFEGGQLDVIFDLYLEDCSPLLDLAVSGRVPHPDPCSDHCFNLVRSWMEECFNEHTESCPRNFNVLMPTRVLDVEPEVNSASKLSLRLVEVQGAGNWVALSHCWGSRGHFITTNDNLAARKESIAFRDLPYTFQDAVAVTRRLGFRYLWIDSLCIIQDDRQDWIREAVKMQLYYKNAILTLSVDSAAGDNEGFLHKKRHNESPLAAFSLKISELPKLVNDISAHPDSAHKLFVRKAYERGPSKEPLHERAWTLQENILSPRIIQYALQELQWDCRKKLAYESELAPARRGYIHKKSLLLSPSQPMQKGRAKGDTTFDGLCNVWYKIVDDYTNRALTIPFDKFPAISGIAREFHQRTNATYRAGIWLEDFHRGLLWSYQGRGRKPSHYHAPSWSWASLDALSDLKVHFTHNLYNFFICDLVKCLPDKALKAELIDCQIALQYDDPYGATVGGRLTLRSYWIPWANGRRRGKDIVGFSPPVINRYDGPFISNRDLRDSESEERIICSFDEYYDDENSDVFQNLSLLHVALWAKTTFAHLGCANYWRQFALLLEPAACEGEDGYFRRVGIAELPSTYDELGFYKDGWEVRTVTIV